METRTTIAIIKLINQDLVITLKIFNVLDSNLDKLEFLLTTLEIFNVLDSNLKPIPEPTDNSSNELKAKRKKKQELVCCGHVLDDPSDSMYDLYTDTPPIKEILNALEFKYKAKEEGTKKFLFQYTLISK